MDSTPEINHQLAETFLHITDELRSESARGAVILAFAWMDDELTRSLKKFFLPSPHCSEKNDELFGVGRPIGDAATKIDIAFRLGIINSNTHKSLHIIRKLRNDFAHMASRLNFETNSVRDRVNTLFELQKYMTDAIVESAKENPDFVNMFPDCKEKPSHKTLLDILGTETLFRILAAILVSSLKYLSHNVSQISHTTQQQQ